VRSSLDRRALYDLAHLGEAIGDPSRAAMLIALMGGVARPASELARAARIAPSTASSHLRQLVRAGLVVVREQGRHRYFALAGPRVAETIERLATLHEGLPSPVPRHDDALAVARTCYTHLAGRIAVAFWARAVERDWVRWADTAVNLSTKGHEELARQGLDVDVSLPGSPCLDWTERRPHVSGRLGIAVCVALLEGGWLKRIPDSRVLRVTSRGARGFAALGVKGLGR
jgi:DNA-binding transcriptional ArsR family regulator